MIPTWVSFLLGAIIYTCGAFLSNSPTMKQSPYYIYYGLSLGLVANAVWFSLVKYVSEPARVLIYGMYWDIIILASFIAVPVLFYGAKFKFLTGLGLFFIVLGFILTKVKV